MAVEPQWNAQRYAQAASFVPEYGKELVDLLALKPTDWVLDLGCGDGTLTQYVESSVPQGGIVGVDHSPEMLEASIYRGIAVQLADGQSLDYHEEFDKVLSNAALHWMKRDPGAVTRGVYGALKPGGTFVGELGGSGNVRAVRNALHRALRRRSYSEADIQTMDPWYFPSIEEYRQLLETAGFSVEAISLTPRPTAVPAGLESWLLTFVKPFMSIVPQVDSLILEIVNEVTPTLTASNGILELDYVRLRFVATKPF